MWSQSRGVGKLRVDAQAGYNSNYKISTLCITISGSLWVVPMVLQVLPGKKN